MPAYRLSSADDVADPDALGAVLGPVRAVSRAPLATGGYTAAGHERLSVTLATGQVRHLVVKLVRVAADWTAFRTGDRQGREALLLAEPALAAVWEAMECPYVAFWSGDGEIGLVMDDLGPFLLPDVREPLTDVQEEQLLSALATMHARFWAAPVLDLPWLARPRHYAGILDAHSPSSVDAESGVPGTLGEQVARGWAAARRHLPAWIETALTEPAMDAVRDWEELPRTLLHGDAKVANFAILPTHRVAAFDWAMLGAGPVSVDLGWYLAINASRLARPRDEVVVRYRARLAEELGSPPSDALWGALMRVAVICGARMLLWSKALALEANRPGAREEWGWWVEHLEAAFHVS